MKFLNALIQDRKKLVLLGAEMFEFMHVNYQTVFFVWLFFSNFKLNKLHSGNRYDCFFFLKVSFNYSNRMFLLLTPVVKFK